MKRFILGAVAAVVIGLGITAGDASAHWEVRHVRTWNPVRRAYVIVPQRVWVPEEVVAASPPVVTAAPVVVTPAPVVEAAPTVVTPAPVVVTPAPVVVRPPLVIRPRPFMFRPRPFVFRR